MTAPAKQILFRSLLVLLLVAAVYAATCSHGFVWDDNYIIANNPLLEKLSNIPRLFLAEDTVEEPSGYYRPVTYVSFALDRAVWGGNPAGFHLTNLLLHLLVVLLFYRVTAALFKKERLALVAALVFALHPLAGETVNFLSGGRNTLLCAFFGLLSLFCYLQKKPVSAVAFFTVAIFAKEFALLLPVVFLFYDCRLRREKLRVGRYLPYLVPTVVYLALRSVAVQKANFLTAVNLADTAKAPYLVVRYLWNMLAPLQLQVLYHLQPEAIACALCALLVVAMLGAVFLFRKHDELLFSACWFLLFLLPVVNIIPLHSTTLMADRYAYFSLMGFAIWVALAFDKLNARTATLAIAALCTLYALIDINRNGIWENEIGFFTRMTRDVPDSFVGFKNLGMAYYRKGDLAHAADSLQAADARPDITVKYLIGDAYIFWKENMPDKAERALSKVMAREPLNAEPYLLLMLMQAQRGNEQLARSYRDKVQSLGHPIDRTLADRTVELCRSGETLLYRRQYLDAEIYFWQALQINAGYVPALIDMGSLKAERMDLAGAERYFGKALALEPGNDSARHNLSMVYRMRGR